MSAQELMRRSVVRLATMRDRHAEVLYGMRFIPKMSGQDGQTSTASTAEEIALQVVELTAAIRSFTLAIATIQAELNNMEQPDKKDQKSQETVAEKAAMQEQIDKGAY